MKKLLFALVTTTLICCNPDTTTPILTEEQQWADYDKKYIIGVYDFVLHEAAYFGADGYINDPGYLQSAMSSEPASGTIRFTADSFFIYYARPSIYRTFPKEGKWMHTYLETINSQFISIYMDSYDNDGNDESIPSDTSRPILQKWGGAFKVIGPIGITSQTPNRRAVPPPGKKPYLTFKHHIAFYNRR